MLFSIFLIFTGAAVIATAALYAKQSLLLAYIGLGMLMGPWGFALITDPQIISDLAHVGIIFLLFLLGLNLEPQDLLRVFREAVVVTLVSSTLFGIAGAAIAYGFEFSLIDCLLIGITLMFSSTIIGLKLLPTTALHHQHMGRIIVSVLLLQDIIAVLVLLALQSFAGTQQSWSEAGLTILALPTLVGASYLGARYLLTRLFAAYDQIQEYIFLLTIGWCLGFAQLGHSVGLSYEIGAFIGGVGLAANPIARFIAESLKPLRDFFLVMFFFALGAGFDISVLPMVALPGCVLAVTVLVGKPLIFKWLLQRQAEKRHLAGEIGVRLGQVSEFSLLVVLMALQLEVISEHAASLVQSVTILTFLASSYWIVLRYPTPIALPNTLRKD